MRCRARWCFWGLLLPLLLTAVASAQAGCQQSTAALQSMEQRTAQFRDGDGGVVQLAVRLAESSRQRGAGMQHLCEIAVRANPMLFRFGQPVQHAFHMQNVHVPLDILFLDADGVIRSQQTMMPGDSLYWADHPFLYALELLAGEAERLGLRQGMQLHLIDSD